jgi:nucleoside-diphosphate-sugar epimerase
VSGGEQIRDFMPVEEVASAIVNIALQNKVSGIINCCSGKPVTVKDFVQSYLLQQNKEIKLNPGYYPYPDYEPMRFWGDNTKLKTIINNE